MLGLTGSKAVQVGHLHLSFKKTRSFQAVGIYNFYREQGGKRSDFGIQKA